MFVRLNSVRWKMLSVIVMAVFTCICADAQIRENLAPELYEKLDAVVFSSDESGGESTFSDARKDVKHSTFAEYTDAQGRPVYSVEVYQEAKNQYGVTLRWHTQTPVHKGDVLLARLTLRTVYASRESGESEVHFYLQTASYAKAFNTPLGSDTSWKTFNIPFVADRDYPAGTSLAELAFGTLRQKVEFTGVEILNFKDRVAFEDLPETSYTYAGREEGAQWREDALERIQELRTAPVKVTVTDKKGRPVKAASVHVKMLKSDFLWGSAANERLCAGMGESSDIYRTYFLKLFNTATLENGLKVKGWADTPESTRRSATVRAFEWLYDNGINMRGHNLVWPGWKFNCAADKELALLGDKDMFDEYVKGRFYERMAYTKGRVVAWDVINEMLHERDMLPYLPEDAPAQWFDLARRLDPEAELFINDYNMLTGAQSVQKCNEYLAMIQDLRAKGAEIDGIGIQGHIGRQPRDPELILSDLDIFRPLGLPVQITEFDIETRDEQLQADYTRDFLIAVYSHPLVNGVILWGFWEGCHWKKDAAMYRKDWSPKPNAEVWQQLVLNEWSTDVTLKTGRDGSAVTRAHLGEYEITVQIGGKTVSRKHHVGHEGEELSIQL